MKGPKTNDRRFPLPRRTGHGDFPHPALARVVYCRERSQRHKAQVFQMSIQADALAHKNQKLREEYLPAADVAAVEKEWKREVRAKFMALPARLKARFPHWPPQFAVRRSISTEGTSRMPARADRCDKYQAANSSA